MQYLDAVLSVLWGPSEELGLSTPLVVWEWAPQSLDPFIDYHLSSQRNMPWANHMHRSVLCGILRGIKVFCL